MPQEALLSLILRLTGQGSFDSLLEHAHGRARPPHRAGSFLGERVLTGDGKVALSPPVLLKQAEERLEPCYAREIAESKRLKLITKRAVTTHNSWTHNLPELVEGERDSNYLYMHPRTRRRPGSPRASSPT